jgi:hypothetical protein
MPLKLNQMLGGDCPSKYEKPGREIELCNTDSSVIVREWGAIILPRLRYAVYRHCKAPCFVRTAPRSKFSSSSKFRIKPDTELMRDPNNSADKKQKVQDTVFIYRQLVKLHIKLSEHESKTSAQKNAIGESVDFLLLACVFAATSAPRPKRGF